MTLEVDKTYIFDWGKTVSELHIIEVTADAIRATLVKDGKSPGAWYFKKDLEAKAVKQLDRDLL